MLSLPLGDGVSGPRPLLLSQQLFVVRAAGVSEVGEERPPHRMFRVRIARSRGTPAAGMPQCCSGCRARSPGTPERPPDWPWGLWPRVDPLSAQLREGLVLLSSSSACRSCLSRSPELIPGGQRPSASGPAAVSSHSASWPAPPRVHPPLLVVRPLDGHRAPPRPPRDTFTTVSLHAHTRSLLRRTDC